MLVLQVMRGERFRPAVLTTRWGGPAFTQRLQPKVCVLVVCESEAQRLAPIMTLQINIMNCGGTDPSLPERMLGAQGRVVRSITRLHRGVKMPTDLISTGSGVVSLAVQAAPPRYQS